MGFIASIKPFELTMSVSKRQQKRDNAHLEHLAREVEMEANRKRLEIVSLKRIDEQIFNQKF